METSRRRTPSGHLSGIWHPVAPVTYARGSQHRISVGASTFLCSWRVISCIERLDEYPEEIIPQLEGDLEFTSDDILEAASRAAELLAAGCSTAFLTALACNSEWRTIAQESFRSFARAHPDFAAEFSGLLTKFLDGLRKQ